MRNLAQRSAQAAKEIKALIADSVEKVKDGADLVTEAGKTMDEVVGSFQQVAGLMHDVASASKEQYSGIEQVSEAVSQMDQVTQQNAALVEEAAAAAESLEEQSRTLAAAVAMFKLDAGASHRAGDSGFAERRGPNRVPNVARLPAAKGRKVVNSAASNVDEEWEEF